MGILSTLLGGFLGGDDKKPVAIPSSVTPADATKTKTPEELLAAEEAKRKAALVASNAGNSQSTTVGGGNADVTRKVLLGL